MKKTIIYLSVILITIIIIFSVTLAFDDEYILYTSLLGYIIGISFFILISDFLIKREKEKKK